MVILSLVMIVKNEEDRIKVSLESVKGIADNFVIMDTGSEDGTVDIIKNYCNDNKIPLHLMEKTFPQPFHYANARNVVLDYADDKGDYLILLDCNDELKDGKNLRMFIDNYNGDASAFHICQQWWNGLSSDKYYNSRLVKSKKGWRYKGAIHEYMWNPNRKPGMDLKIEGFYLYQDRTLDDDKSLKRFTRDEEVLEKEYSDNFKKISNGELKHQDPRTVFYYAQTCMCLQKSEKCYLLNRERSEMDEKEVEGFPEEKYHAFYRCAEMSKLLNHSWEESLAWYYKAFDYSTTLFTSPRAEPLYKIADYYKDKSLQLAFMYIKRCCELKFPENVVLFIDRRIYEYMRWVLLSEICLKMNEMELGKIGIINSIVAEKRDDDIKKLELFIKDKKERDTLLNTILNNGEEKKESIVVKKKGKNKNSKIIKK